MDIQQAAEISGVPETDLAYAVETIARFARALRIQPTPAFRLLVDARAQMTGPDSRTASWLCRLRILDVRGDVIADTDPDLDHTADGTDIVAGLPGVAQWAAEIVSRFHKSFAPAKAEEMFNSRVPTLRTSLARNGTGRARWVVNYDADGSRWLVRVDLVQCAPAPVVEARAGAAFRRGAS